MRSKEAVLLSILELTTPWWDIDTASDGQKMFAFPLAVADAGRAAEATIHPILIGPSYQSPWTKIPARRLRKSSPGLYLEFLRGRIV